MQNSFDHHEGLCLFRVSLWFCREKKSPINLICSGICIQKEAARNLKLGVYVSVLILHLGRKEYSEN